MSTQETVNDSNSIRTAQKAVICCIPGTFSRALEGRLRECEVKVAGEQEIIEHLSRWKWVSDQIWLRAPDSANIFHFDDRKPNRNWKLFGFRFRLKIFGFRFRLKIFGFRFCWKIFGFRLCWHAESFSVAEKFSVFQLETGRVTPKWRRNRFQPFIFGFTESAPNRICSPESDYLLKWMVYVDGNRKSWFARRILENCFRQIWVARICSFVVRSWNSQPFRLYQK